MTEEEKMLAEIKFPYYCDGCMIKLNNSRKVEIHRGRVYCCSCAFYQ